MKEEIKKFARDLIALGSWVFYFLVVARALIKPFRPFADHIIIAGAFLLLINLLFIFIKQDYDGYVAKALILMIFTILFYKDNLFTDFVIIVFIGLIICSYIVGTGKKNIFKGLIIGGIVSWISYYLADFSLGLV